MRLSSTTDLPQPMSSPFLSELGRALGYHRWLILIVALGSVLVTYAGLQFVSDQYISKAHLLVKLGRENVELPVTVEKGGLMSTGVRREEINSEIQLITSRQLLEAVVDTMGLAAFKLEPAPPTTWFQRRKQELRELVKLVRSQVKEGMIALNLRPRLSEREEALLLVMNTLTVEREKDSDVIAISTKLPSAALAEQVVNTLVTLYLDRRVSVRRDRGVSEFFDEQLNALRGKLTALDLGKQQLRSQRQISSVNEERNLLLSRLQLLYSEIAIDQRELSLLGPAPVRASTGAEGLAKVGLGASPATVTRPAEVALSSYPNLEQLRSKVTELRLRQTDALQKFNADSEVVLRSDREVAQIEGTLRQAMSSQLAQRRALAASVERRLASLNTGEMEMEVLERDRVLVTQNYQSYAKRREEARVSEALDLRRVSNIAILNAADRPIEPVYPRKVLIIGLALPFGLLAGLAIALLLEYMNQTFRDERDFNSSDRALFMGLLRVDKGESHELAHAATNAGQSVPHDSFFGCGDVVWHVSGAGLAAHRA
jgi:uncharacterized protein involved in exopolysaccharide biosynthesis